MKISSWIRVSGIIGEDMCLCIICLEIIAKLNLASPQSQLIRPCKLLTHSLSSWGIEFFFLLNSIWGDTAGEGLS